MTSRKPRIDVDVVLRGPGDVVVLVRDYVEKRHLVPPCQLAIGIDRHTSLTGIAYDDGAAEPWDLSATLALATGLHAVTLLLVELRAGPPVPPDIDEVRDFFALRAATDPAGVEVLDMIVICERQWWSLRSFPS